jgi:glycosyltransferase involved in cell wall biosynthesis
MQGLTIGIVYSYEEEALLERCLESIERQRKKLESIASTIHIVIVRTPQARGRKIPYVQGQIIDAPTENLASNRNLALEACQTEGFYFIDPDCWLSDNSLPDLCQKLIKAISFDSKIFACAGPNRLVSKNQKFENFLKWLGNLKWLNGGLSQLVTNGKDRYDWHSPTCNILYWMPILQRPYFSSLFPQYGEDLEFHFRQSRNGRKILICGEAFVWHEQPTSRSRYFKKIFHYGTSQTQLLRMHPSSFFNRRLWVLAVNIILISVAVFLPFHWFLGILAGSIFIFAVLIATELFLSKEKSSPLDYTFLLCMILMSYSFGQLSGLVLPFGQNKKAVGL